MGQLVNGKWVEDQGYTPGAHDNELDTKHFPLDPAKDSQRYHLYIGNSCPYAHRALIAYYLNGLDKLIGLSFVAPANTDNSWEFHSKEFPNIKDNALNKSVLHEVYTACDSKYNGRVTIPLLVDLKPTSSLGGDGQVRIVTNESSTIVDTFFKLGAKLNTTKLADLSPLPEVDSTASSFGNVIYSAVGVRNQTQYDYASENIYECLQELDSALAHSKYLAGDEISNIDVVFFPFLIRFDVAFSQLIHFTRARISDFKNLNAYLHRVYSDKQVQQTVYVDQIRAGMMAPLYRNKFKIPYEIVPSLPYLDWIGNN